jgi:hypothetical protein
MRVRVLTLVLLVGCTGEIVPGVGPGSGADGGLVTGADGGPPSVPTGDGTLAITAPAAGSSYMRAAVGSAGTLVARVPFSADASGDIARIEVAVDGEPALSIEGPAWDGDVDVADDGAHTLTATGYDAAGATVTLAEVDVSIDPPQAESCHEWLDLYGLDYELGPSREGVADPVTVTTPINGIEYRYYGQDKVRSSMFMDCELALSLAEAASHLRAHDVVEATDIGIYNYRCIGGGTPPDCPRGVSEHAYALAIDLHGFTDAGGTFYSVEDDWVIDPDGEETCSATTENAKDRFLHELICELKDAGVWNIVLTPNYNADHRNHFHVDLKPGSDFIEFTDPWTVDVGPDLH